MIDIARTPGPYKRIRSKEKHDGEFDYGILAPKDNLIAEAFGRSSRGVLPAKENVDFLVLALNHFEALFDVAKRVRETENDPSAHSTAHGELNRVLTAIGIDVVKARTS